MESRLCAFSHSAWVNDLNEAGRRGLMLPLTSLLWPFH
jgi:hypothetical protein